MASKAKVEVDFRPGGLCKLRLTRSDNPTEVAAKLPGEVEPLHSRARGSEPKHVCECTQDRRADLASAQSGTCEGYPWAGGQRNFQIGYERTRTAALTPQYHTSNTSKPLTGAMPERTKPVLVRAYSGKPTSMSPRSGRPLALPPISAFDFADILRAADGPDFQAAIDGIAEICAKNRMSLAEEYGSHRPPVGEITALPAGTVGSVPIRKPLDRPTARRALTSVPEASSSSSEGSTKSRRRSIFGFKAKQDVKADTMRIIRIGSMGRSISVGGITAMTHGIDDSAITIGTIHETLNPVDPRPRVPGAALMSLKHLIGPQSGAGT